MPFFNNNDGTTWGTDSGDKGGEWDGDDFIEVEPPASIGAWRRATLRTYDDHRMAMCLSLAAFNPLAGGHVPVRLLDPRCVAKTYPEYFEALFEVVNLEQDHHEQSDHQRERAEQHGAEHAIVSHSGA